MKSDFDVMSEMANASKDICMAPPSNVKRMNAGKGEYGEIVIAIPKDKILNANKYLFALYIINREEFMNLKNESEKK